MFLHPLLPLQAVQQVISNLLISHIELRSEASPDIQAHTHQRTLEKVVVPLGETLAAQQARYLQVGPSFFFFAIGGYVWQVKK